ncbi:hypothetical protein [Legionella bononiensis]|uniref:hypothetical protein n=1 Tax=Legionella bononiensis TaxID=2793102 RepID=UPI001EE41D97|nr:hypothetical protein [Legionella bononiensis]MBL7480618.1 hypothetical protein [Legionella bononiensis]MBL7563322.1 hypothetical protein [Legionella bononiensis]
MNLTWANTPSLQEEIAVAKFTDEYQKIHASKYFQFLRSNFLNCIPQDASNREKLQIIKTNIKENPSSTSAEAWTNCKFTKETLELIGTMNESPSSNITPTQSPENTIQKTINFKQLYSRITSRTEDPEEQLDSTVDEYERPGICAP